MKKKNTDPDPLPYIQAMAEKDQNPAVAEHAFGKIHTLYIDYVRKICYAHLHRRPGFNPEHIRLVANNILITLYHKADKFNPNATGKVTNVTNDKKFKGWLEGFAKMEAKKYNRLIEMLRGPVDNMLELSEEVLHDKLWQSPDDENDELSPLSQERLKFIESCLQEEPPDHQAVFRTRLATADHKGKVPNYIANNLDREFGILPNYQRLIVKRILDRIKIRLIAEQPKETSKSK